MRMPWFLSKFGVFIQDLTKFHLLQQLHTLILNIKFLSKFKY